MFAMHSGIKDSYVDILALGSLPQLQDTELLKTPRQTIFCLLSDQLGIVDFLRLYESDLLVWQDSDDIRLRNVSTV